MIIRHLKIVADCLAPDLRAKLLELIDLELKHQDALDEIRELGRQLHRAQALTGELRQRLTRAEARLEQLDVDEISKARRSAFFAGAGYIRIASLGRGRFQTEHIPSERVTIHVD